MSIGKNLWRRIVWATLGASALAAVGLVLAIWRGFRAGEPPGALPVCLTPTGTEFAEQRTTSASPAVTL